MERQIIDMLIKRRNDQKELWSMYRSRSRELKGEGETEKAEQYYQYSRQHGLAESQLNEAINEALMMAHQGQ